MDNSELAKRMKRYEQVTNDVLIIRMPVIIRIDGKAFHTFTRGFQKPFDEILIKSMQETMKFLCENIQGCVFGYTQSDEISLVLVDYKNIGTDSWLDYRVQKICSITASMATMAFNKAFSKIFNEWVGENFPDWYSGGTNALIDKKLMAKYLLENGSQIPYYVLYQAEFKQGNEVWKQMGDTYYCYEYKDK